MQGNNTTVLEEPQALNEDIGKALEGIGLLPIQEERLSTETAENIIEASLGMRIDELDEALLDTLIDTVSLAHLSLEGEVTHG